jgi:hypothetical protein
MPPAFLKIIRFSKTIFSNSSTGTVNDKNDARK